MITDLELVKKSIIIYKSLLKVGNRFQTFNNEKNQNSKGLGLGLVICQEMIN